MLQRALEQDDLLPKYREYIKQRIEESSPVDYREIRIPGPSLFAVSTPYNLFRSLLIHVIAPVV